MKYDIVIPSWNQKELACKCLESIRTYSEDYRVIFVDNGSDEEEFNAVYQTLQTMPHKLIRNTQNLGFVKAANQGLYFSTAPFVVLMNNDTEAVENWLVKLEGPFHRQNDIMLTGPCTNARNSWQGHDDKPETWWNGKLHISETVILLPKNAMLAFFCTMFRKEIFNICGYLDEDFGIGFGDDDWYCWNVQNRGFRLALVTDLVIPHHHRSTFKKIYEQATIQEMQSNAMAIFKKKVADNAVARPPAKIVATRTGQRIVRGRNVRVRRFP